MIVRKNVRTLKGNQKVKGILLKSNIICVTRDSNMDGISAPALLMHNYGMKADNIMFTNYSNFKGLFGLIKKIDIKGSVFVFSDLGMSKVNITYSLKILELLKSRKVPVVWLDHHPWEEKMVRRFRNYFDFAILGESRRYCAAEMVYLVLCKRDKTGDRIASFAHYADFVIKSRYERLLRKLSYSIVYFEYDKNRQGLLKKLTMVLSKLDLKNKMIDRAYHSYIEEERRNKKYLLGNSYSIDAGNYRIGIAFGKRIQTNSACAAIHNKFRSDISIYVNIETGKCGVRSLDHVDSSKISRALGGGGHPQASAFNIKPSRFKGGNKNEMKRFVERINRTSGKMY